MSQDLIITLAKDTLQVTLMLSAPLLLISLTIGIVISILQVVTSIQDMTLSFVPRVLAVFTGFLILFPWLMNVMLKYSSQLLGHLERFAH